MKWEQQRDERMRQQIKENRCTHTHTRAHTHTRTCTRAHTHAHAHTHTHIQCNLYSSCHSLELRELEARLKAGYMNKERAAQLAEKKAIKIKDEVCILYTCTSFWCKFTCLSGLHMYMNTCKSLNHNSLSCEQFMYMYMYTCYIPELHVYTLVA